MPATKIKKGQIQIEVSNFKGHTMLTVHSKESDEVYEAQYAKYQERLADGKPIKYVPSRKGILSKSAKNWELLLDALAKPANINKIRKAIADAE